jgi:hypothetical protein
MKMKFAMHFKPKCMKIGLLFRTPMDTGKDASNRVKLGTAFLYSAVRHLCALSVTRVRKKCGKLRNIKVAQASFCCTDTQLPTGRRLSTHVLKSIPHNGISSSHNGISGLSWSEHMPQPAYDNLWWAQ